MVPLTLFGIYTDSYSNWVRVRVLESTPAKKMHQGSQIYMPKRISFTFVIRPTTSSYLSLIILCLLSFIPSFWCFYVTVHALDHLAQVAERNNDSWVATMMPVNEETLALMQDELSQHPLYPKYEYLLRPDYLKLVMGQLKGGKQRTFEYSFNKMTTMMETIEGLELEEFIRDIPQYLIDNPPTYRCGFDREGRPIVVSDFNSLDFKKLKTDQENILKYFVLVNLSIVKDMQTPTFVTLGLSYKAIVGVRSMITNGRAIQPISQILLKCLPDRLFRDYEFAGSALRSIFGIITAFLPKHTREKIHHGKPAYLLGVMAEHIENPENCVPADIGGNGAFHIHQVEWTLAEDGTIEATFTDVSTGVTSLEEPPEVIVHPSEAVPAKALPKALPVVKMKPLEKIPLARDESLDYMAETMTTEQEPLYMDEKKDEHFALVADDVNYHVDTKKDTLKVLNNVSVVFSSNELSGKPASSSLKANLKPLLSTYGSFWGREVELVKCVERSC